MRVILVCPLRLVFLLQDFDGGEVGQSVSRAVVASSGAPTALSWKRVSIDLFPNGVLDLEDAVVQEKAWAIIASASPVIVRCVIKRAHAPPLQSTKMQPIR